MFKKGQLVKSLDTGAEYFVRGHEHPGFGVLLEDAKGRRFKVNLDDLELIGNNYQAKQKCSR